MSCNMADQFPLALSPGIRDCEPRELSRFLVAIFSIGLAVGGAIAVLVLNGAYHCATLNLASEVSY